ncbi:MAG: 30S ribosomal protein S4 [Candidatus Thermoplasmatota archaeon]|nr:30S ribosomal protein S4 [Candidatus Thermoplasmatota archaeon]
MGDPKKLRRKYDTPSHPWRGDRIKEEKELMAKFGLKNKKEVWRMKSYLRDLRGQTRMLQAKIRTEDQQAIKEADLLLNRCYSMGILPEGAPLQEVLAIQLDLIISRRLESLVYAKGLASTYKQARQMITHGHVTLKGRRVTIPGMLVRKGEERTIEYDAGSPFTSEMHPMRPQTSNAGEPEPSQVPLKIKIEAPGP